MYEVHPKTRLRITTRTPTTKAQSSQTTAQLKSIDVDTDYSYQDDYVYEPTSAPKVVQVEDEVLTTTVPEYVPTVSTEQTTDNDAVHETADKHSTTTLPSVLETTFSYDDNELDNEIPDQLVEESQRVETTWNGVLDVTSGVPVTSTETSSTVTSRLSSYEKDVDTSKYGDDKEYNVEALVPQVNEHSKQVPSGNDDDCDSNDDKIDNDLMMIVGDNDASWQPSPVKPVKSYTEIQRGVARVEEVDITETTDYTNQTPDIIYDVTKDGFTDDAVDTFSVPVAVAFNVPAETAAPTVTTTETVQAETTQETVDTTANDADVTTSVAVEDEVTTTVAAVTTTTAAPTTTVAVTTEEVTTTTTQAPTTTEKYPTTYSRIYNLIQRNRNNLLATTSRSVFGEVYLGSRPTTTERPAPTSNVVIDLSKSAHKIPNSLWSTFEKTRETEQEDNTEGYKEASIMSYSTPANNTTKDHVVAELPKPSKHESEVLVEKVERVTGGGFVPKKRISVKNKDKWLKDLVSRKYNKKPKFTRGPLLPLAPTKVCR